MMARAGFTAAQKALYAARAGYRETAGYQMRQLATALRLLLSRVLAPARALARWVLR